MNFEIDKLIKMGKGHSLHCEDDYFIEENDDFIVAAVFDGCSSGIDSHYASTRHKYLLKDVISHYKAILSNGYGLNKTINYYLKNIIYGIFVGLLREKYKVNLEMLSTIVLLFINKHTKEYGIVFCGDGCCCINNENVSIHDPNGNTVWYLSSIVEDYYSQLNDEDIFDIYYNDCEIYTGKIEDNMTIAISTDGIESFMTKYGSCNIDYPIKVLFNTTELAEKFHKWNMERLYNVMTKGKLPELNGEGISNIDDLTVIKIKCDEDKTD